MTIFSGQSAVLKIEDSPGAGTYSTVAYLQSCDISISNDEPTVPLMMHTHSQHAPDASAARSVTVSGSGFANDEGVLDSSVDRSGLLTGTGRHAAISRDGNVIAIYRNSTFLDVYQWAAGAWSLYQTISIVSGEIYLKPALDQNGLTLIVVTSTVIKTYTRASTAVDFVLLDTASAPSVSSYNAVSLSGDASVCAIGYYRYDGTHLGQGLCLIYEFSGGTWTLRDSLLSPTPTYYGGFSRGVYLTADGSTLYITDAGLEKIHVLDYDSGWTFRAEYAPIPGAQTPTSGIPHDSIALNLAGTKLYYCEYDDAEISIFNLSGGTWSVGSTSSITPYLEFCATENLSTVVASRSGATVYHLPSSSPTFLLGYLNTQTTPKARLYLSATEYYEGDARITALNYSGGHSGALALNISMTLSNVSYT